MGVHSCGLTCIGMPLYVGMSFLASAPISSFRSADPHCQFSEAFLPARSSFRRFDDNVDVKETVYTTGRLTVQPSKASGQVRRIAWVACDHVFSFVPITLSL